MKLATHSLPVIVEAAGAEDADTQITTGSFPAMIECHVNLGFEHTEP